MVKKEISNNERFERSRAVESWQKTKAYIAKKAKKGYKSDPTARSSQKILDELGRYKQEWNQARKDHQEGKIDGPEKHSIDSKLYRKIKLLEQELKNLRLW